MYILLSKIKNLTDLYEYHYYYISSRFPLNDIRLLLGTQLLYLLGLLSVILSSNDIRYVKPSSCTSNAVLYWNHFSIRLNYFYIMYKVTHRITPANILLYSLLVFERLQKNTIFFSILNISQYLKIRILHNFDW